MIGLIRCLLACKDPVLRRQILRMKMSNLCLKAQIFRFECRYVLLNVYAGLLYLRMKFWIWFYTRVLHTTPPFKHETNTNDPEN